MAIWRIDLFETSKDKLPFRSGYCHAADQNEAVEKAGAALKADSGATSVDAIKITARSIPPIPTDNVLWDGE